MELIKTWRRQGFTLRMWDTHTRDHRGQTNIRYQLKDGRKVIFEGRDFSCSPLYCDDSLDSVCALLGFLTLKPGDTDKEYFDKYTAEQREWSESDRAEELSCIVYEMEMRREEKWNKQRKQRKVK